jgi:transcriptional regulator with XRE-family HTH domain
MPVNIKDIRLRKGLTQSEVATALGVSSVVYSRYENGKRQPSIDTLVQMADIFGVTVAYLLGRQDIEDSTLSEYELHLLIASRNADERAKQDALNMLLAHATSKKDAQD